jgi:hypothetical protein
VKQIRLTVSLTIALLLTKLEINSLLAVETILVSFDEFSGLRWKMEKNLCYVIGTTGTVGTVISGV